MTTATFAATAELADGTVYEFQCWWFALGWAAVCAFVVVVAILYSHWYYRRHKK